MSNHGGNGWWQLLTSPQDLERQRSEQMKAQVGGLKDMSRFAAFLEKLGIRGVSWKWVGIGWLG